MSAMIGLCALAGRGSAIPLQFYESESSARKSLCRSTKSRRQRSLAVKTFSVSPSTLRCTTCMPMYLTSLDGAMPMCITSRPFHFASIKSDTPQPSRRNSGAVSLNSHTVRGERCLMSAHDNPKCDASAKIGSRRRYGSVRRRPAENPSLRSAAMSHTPALKRSAASASVLSNTRSSVRRACAMRSVIVRGSHGESDSGSTPFGLSDDQTVDSLTELVNEPRALATRLPRCSEPSSYFSSSGVGAPFSSAKHTSRLKHLACFALSVEIIRSSDNSGSTAASQRPDALASRRHSEHHCAPPMLSGTFLALFRRFLVHNKWIRCLHSSTVCAKPSRTGFPQIPHSWSTGRFSSGGASGVWLGSSGSGSKLRAG